MLSTDKEQKVEFKQKGIYEKLLCNECEEKLSKYENYARGVLYGGRSISVTHHSQQAIECSIDYSTFKLFQLSILWRIGVSTSEAFSEVDLGGHSEVLRDMVNTGKPGATCEYGCIMIASPEYTEITDNMIHCMGMVKIDTVDCVRILLGGLFWLFFLSDKAIDQRQQGLFLQDTGRLRIMKTAKGISGYIEQFAEELRAANPKLFPEGK